MNTVTGSLPNSGLDESKLEFFPHNFQRYSLLCGDSATLQLSGPSSLNWP